MADKTLKVKVLTPEGSLFEGECSGVFFPGSLGSFEVLPDHAPIISTLEKGIVKLVTVSDGDKEIEISSGAVKVKSNEITVCVESV